MRFLPCNFIADVSCFSSADRSGVQVLPESVQILAGADGRPSGAGTIDVVSRAEAERAVKLKNGQHMGPRFIEIKIV